MAINQAQVDHIISTASADDPEIKMQRLQEEVDLIKKSIKKLLIDIRERMNEVENPFQAGVPYRGEGRHQSGQMEKPEQPVIMPEPTREMHQVQEPPNNTQPTQPQTQYSNVPVQDVRTQLLTDEKVLLAIQEKLGERPRAEEKKQDKLRLQKVHKLFEWTNKTVKKYGHDRLEIMLESYRAMGYITQDACAQVREIARLMPESLGVLHEIGPDEFVTELYGLNRILDPADSSLDSDMIEVLMENRKIAADPGKEPVAHEKNTGTDWANMLDRI